MVQKKTFDLQNVPLGPGVYLFRNASGAVIYVGKAKVLRRRLASYFQPSRGRLADPKLRALIHSIADTEMLRTRTEHEAILLEDRLIKEYKPRYNVDQTDDRRFLLVVLDPDQRFPRFSLARIQRKDGRVYWGPFVHARAMRETVKRVSAFFHLRTCAHGCRVFPHQSRPCIEAEIGNCCAPCTGQVLETEYQSRIERAKRVFSGDTAELVAHFTLRMRVAAEKGEFEEAAILRDIIRNLQSITRKTGSRNPHAHRGVPAPETALAGLARCLGLPKPPRTIECFDVSNIAGCFAVGSMICYQNGRPAPQRYRRYSIRSVEGIDDYAMIREVILRRYRRLRAEGQGLPDLVMVDGGQGQLAAAVSALQETGNATLPIVALAKRDEELFLPGTPLPVRLPRHHPVLRLLQAIRDEAHRFALKYHLSLRHKRLTESILDSVPGISRARRTALLRRFGSVRQVCGATAQEIAAALPGTGVRKAAEILRFLSRKGNPPGT